MSIQNIPRHIAIIMDGNGRWAQEKGLPRIAGHREGIQRVKELIQAAADAGVQVLTLFAFSTENWQRPKAEVAMLMRSLDSFLARNAGLLMKNNIALNVIGRREPIDQKILARIDDVVARTRNNTRLTLCLALNYGSRQELVDAVKAIAGRVADKSIAPEIIDENTITQSLYTAGLPDPDLLIRTSGEQRISNFLLWQLSYAELYFTKKYWPDFKSDDLLRAIKQFQKRDRRFGKVRARE